MHAAFKEWAVICEALGAGLQSVIIRKGGLAEGKAGFAFRHDEFLLFPTWFHEQLEKTTLPPDTVVPEEPGEELEVRYTATIEWSGLLSDWQRVSRLRALHVLRDSVVEERYRYRETEGVQVAFVRVYRLDPPIRLRNEKRYGGCRSWIDLPEVEGSVLVSVISDEEHQRRRKLLE
ncbi:MAG TPA: DUF1802 family protein, partial [Terrimicrobiaceae bacterium]|nr:DUF1802 family protein [Terrimicrobiaceae bacterium]